ncbi:LysE family translocator [Roseibium denhamense]|uniref:Resistance to homoserine/threonine (RhtB) family protein n=1 Tax=Roseibium denhamense TaxID=76305 RepID=A0ABY1N7G6_9HYPH|nr:LysE family transporter [Roseibium denhamense]MTI05986.1 LysE family translocator [Roseibium denhamense]SMP02465.1 resistance to homoserine/threonine (RhtB) family protein [Roseibium denhamense]
MTEWLAVFTITIFAVLSPGPDFAMVSRNALIVSRRAGVVTALGIAAGVLIHVGYTLLGVGILIEKSPVLFSVLKTIGAAYLVYLGATMLLSRKMTAKTNEAAKAIGSLAALRTGFLTNVLNPKTTIFIVSLFLQVVSPSTPLVMQLAYGVFISAAHAVWFALVAVFFSSPKIQERLYAMKHWIDRAFGATLIGFGISLAAANVAR